MLVRKNGEWERLFGICPAPRRGEIFFILDLIAVGAGGAVGASGRYLLGLIPIHPRSGFPMLTFFINVSGAFCIGLLAALAARHTEWNPRIFLFLKVGICGGFTTFSTFSLETTGLLQSGRPLTGIAYVVLSVLLSIAAVFGAQLLVR